MTWSALAHAALQYLIERGTPFSTNDVWLLIERPDEPRALGNVIREYAHAGRIVPTGKWVRCSYKSRHDTVVREWVAA
jgi:hypothetical protein